MHTRAYRRLSTQVGTDPQDRLRYGYGSRGTLVIHDPATRPNTE